MRVERGPAVIPLSIPRGAYPSFLRTGVRIYKTGGDVPALEGWPQSLSFETLRRPKSSEDGTSSPPRWCSFCSFVSFATRQSTSAETLTSRDTRPLTIRARLRGEAHSLDTYDLGLFASCLTGLKGCSGHSNQPLSQVVETLRRVLPTSPPLPLVVVGLSINRPNFLP